MIIENYIDLCAGIGCVPYAMKCTGIEIKNHYYSEIDKYAISNYKKNYPNAKYIGAIADFHKAGITHADLITFGWPCQGNSIAGKRGGLSGHIGSGLLFEICRILQSVKPLNFVAENVKGLLSVNKSADILTALEILSFVYEDSEQYDVEVELLNTRNFGIPQSRERLYFAGHLRGRSTRKVFPLGEGVSEDNEKGIQRTDYCGTINGKNNSGQLSLDSGTMLVVNDRGGLPQTASVNNIDGNYNKGMDNHGQRSMVLQVNPSTESQKLTFGSDNDKTGLYQISETIGNSDAQRIYSDNGVARSQKGLSGGQGGKTGLYLTGSRVRRLVPIEAERLFGLPDNYTKYGIDEKGNQFEISDSQRYKMLGNGISREPMETILKRMYDMRNLKKTDKAK